MKDLSKAIEHFIPREGLELEPYLNSRNMQAIHHLARYHWACGVLQEFPVTRIVDIACGAGYGSYLLARALPEADIIGVDYDPRAVAIAREAYSAPNLSYRWGDMIEWRFMDSLRGDPLPLVDAIVSFDTIEHVAHRDIALLRMAQNLSPTGLLLLSTPSGRDATAFSGFCEVSHQVEYGAKDLVDILSRFFGEVLTPEQGSLPNLRFFAEIINANEVLYLNRSNPVVCLAPKK